MAPPIKLPGRFRGAPITRHLFLAMGRRPHAPHARSREPRPHRRWARRCPVAKAPPRGGGPPRSRMAHPRSLPPPPRRRRVGGGGGRRRWRDSPAGRPRAARGSATAAAPPVVVGIGSSSVQPCRDPADRDGSVRVPRPASGQNVPTQEESRTSGKTRCVEPDIEHRHCCQDVFAGQHGGSACIPRTRSETRGETQSVTGGTLQLLTSRGESTAINSGQTRCHYQANGLPVQARNGPQRCGPCKTNAGTTRDKPCSLQKSTFATHLTRYRSDMPYDNGHGHGALPFDGARS